MHPALQPLLDFRLDGRTKGYPQDRPPARLGDVGALGLGLEDLGSPVAILRDSALDANSRWMRAFLAKSGASLCPHGKTTMAPQLFHRQLEDGAWGLTLATPQQVRVAREFGVPRVLLANELVDEGAIRWVRGALDADAAFDFTCLVDGPGGVARLAASRGRRPLDVLVELGLPGGRTGARGPEAALEVARAVKAASGLRLRGVECYEGIVQTQDPAQDEARINAWLDALGELATACGREDLFETEEVLLSAGGSAYFDLVARRLSRIDLGRPSRVLLRSGCYLSHDAGHYRRLVQRLEGRLPSAWRSPEHLEPALEVWGRVLSRPEPGMAFLDLGKRDVAHDLGLPQPARWLRPGMGGAPRPASSDWGISMLHDQHARLDVPPDADLAVGDLVGCAISHPCTTFDKWPVVFRVDDAYRVTGAVKTCF